MAALAPDGEGGEETVKTPGALVVSAYVTCPDVRQVVARRRQAPDRAGSLAGDRERPGEQQLGGGGERAAIACLVRLAVGQQGLQPFLGGPFLISRAWAGTFLGSPTLLHLSKVRAVHGLGIAQLLLKIPAGAVGVE